MKQEPARVFRLMQVEKKELGVSQQPTPYLN
jgi:hypothetical protein